MQGVGFRPFVYRLANELGLDGWVLNDVRGVEIALEGSRLTLEHFRDRLERQPPPLAQIHRISERWAETRGERSFRILDSEPGGQRLAVLLPDVATCCRCTTEIFDPADRRHGYAFTNCTDCGPRFSIVRALPYDRPNTSMADFQMCARCQREYDDPLDRRFHAQPNACPQCGPKLRLLDTSGRALGGEAIAASAGLIAEGKILALEGLGGFQLMVDATNQEAVQELRRRKGRPSKPLALMVADLEAARRLTDFDALESELLLSSTAPIVLLNRSKKGQVAEAVAPGQPHLGIMLPTTPLHHLLLRKLASPVVATSGNLSDEPICFDPTEALHRLGGIADAFLIHDRPIVRHVDDSVMRVIAKGPQVLRRARGLAPMPLLLKEPGPDVLAVGAHLKNTIALSSGERVFISQHIGDMDRRPSEAAFCAVIADFLAMYDTLPVALAHDLHPDAASTRWAQDAAQGRFDAPPELLGLPLIPVQHHHAHLASCLAENRIDGPTLGIIWDGTGLGTDDTIWGGEFLLGDAAGYRRVGRLRTFALPGGDAAIRDPRRSALALLEEIDAIDKTFAAHPQLEALFGSELETFRRMFARDINCPRCSSMGRLFDGFSVLLGLGAKVSFEGEAAIRLEHAADGPSRTYRFGIREVEATPGHCAAELSESPVSSHLELDWQGVLEECLDDLARGQPRGSIAAGFHDAAVHAVVELARRFQIGRLALSGGCFQNGRLQEDLVKNLQSEGFEAIVHQQIPPNDGGISFGQIAVAQARIKAAGG